MLFGILSTLLQQGLEAHTLIVVEASQAFHIENDDFLERRHSVADPKNFIELFFILCEIKTSSTVVDQVLDLVGRVRRIDAVRNTTAADDAEIGEHPLLVDLRGNRTDVAAMKPQCHQSQS